MSDTLAFVRAWLGMTWDLFTTVQVPGLGISCASLLMGVFLIGLSIKIFALVVGGSGFIDSHASDGMDFLKDRIGKGKGDS